MQKQHRFRDRIRNSRLYRSTEHVREHLLHVIIAYAMIGQGFVFITSTRYFTWPPFLVSAENDNSVGATFVFTGLMLLIWSFDKQVSDFWEKVLLSLAAFLQLTISLIDFFSWLNDGFTTGNSHGFVTTSAMFLIILLAAGTRKRGIGRDRKRA